MSEDSEVQRILSAIDKSWEDYQKTVKRLYDITGMSGDDNPEWDLTANLEALVDTTRMRVRNTEVNTDQDWNHKCMDDAYDLLGDLERYQEEIKYFIGQEEDEDRDSDSEQ